MGPFFNMPPQPARRSLTTSLPRESFACVQIADQSLDAGGKNLDGSGDVRAFSRFSAQMVN